MKRAIVSVLLLCIFASDKVQAQGAAPDDWKKSGLEIVAWFETKGASWGTVTPDFDCNGISVGILQWNVGTGSLKGLLTQFQDVTLQQYMPTYGGELIKKINMPVADVLAYVRSFQRIKNPSTCFGNKRGATWDEHGQVFSAELSALFSSEEGIRVQTAASNKQADEAWKLAVNWSKEKGGSASPTFKEFAYFYNTYNFSGDFWKKFANYKEVSKLKKQGDMNAYNEVLTYLKTERSYHYYQVWEANQNVELWRDKVPTTEELDLILHAYLVATHIKKPKAIPFRLNSISRAGTVIFNDGYVNRTHKSFPQLNGS